MPKLAAIVRTALVLPAFIAGSAAAQGFTPARPLDLVVHNAPGGGADLLARFISIALEKEKLIPVRSQVINRTGGGGTTAMAYVIEKRGDAHTLALFTAAWIITPMLAEEVKVSMFEMTPVARLVLESALIVVKADSPFRTLDDFIEAAKKEPGKMRQAGGSVQTRGNFVRQMLQKATGAQWTYISFPGGGERVSALLGGHMQLLVAEPQEVSEYLRRGQLRPLAQVAGKRLPAFPEVPTVREAGYNIRSDPTMRGVVAPPGMPKEAQAYWEDLFARFAKSAAWRKYIEDNQFEDGFLRGEDMLKSAREFGEQARGMLRDAGLKVYR